MSEAKAEDERQRT